MGCLSPTLGRCRRDEAVKFLAALSWLLLFSWGLSGVESLCWAGHANKLHHFCLGDRGQWHAICQRQGMNEPHLHCAGRFSPQSSEAAVAKRKVAETQGPPAPRALPGLEGSGQSKGTRGASPSRRECRPHDSEKEPGEIATLCSPCPKEKEERNPWRAFQLQGHKNAVGVLPPHSERLAGTRPWPQRPAPPSTPASAPSTQRGTAHI